ncbi:MAG: carboxylating nicotinate-nucleotide diphosphorylase [Desulfobacterales bacterium]|nr:carboxylating nicotinate-nucleotide diphosphorylase [Desulfobacterales bacterium]
MDGVEQIIRLALAEDAGLGDITTESILPDSRRGKGWIKAKQDLVLAGSQVARQVFGLLDPQVDITFHFKDGDAVAKGDTLVDIQGDLLALLKGERTALNFLQRLSGIATLTRTYVQALDNDHVRLTDTRKTTPGWRRLEKDAVRAGGGYNHRCSLYDGILIKENHIAVAGGIANAVAAVRERTSHLMKIEVEVTSMEEVHQALDAGADVIMLDNMSLEQMTEAVAVIQAISQDRVVIEASGNVGLDTLNPIAQTGVDVISCGALTHQARSVDLSMMIQA